MLFTQILYNSAYFLNMYIILNKGEARINRWIQKRISSEWHPEKVKYSSAIEVFSMKPSIICFSLDDQLCLEGSILPLRSFNSKMHHCFSVSAVPMRCGSLLLHYLFRVSYMAANVGVVSDVHHQQAREESNRGASLIFRFNNIHRIVYNDFERTRYGRNVMVHGVKQILIAI